MAASIKWDFRKTFCSILAVIDTFAIVHRYKEFNLIVPYNNPLFRREYWSVFE